MRCRFDQKICLKFIKSDLFLVYTPKYNSFLNYLLFVDGDSTI